MRNTIKILDKDAQKPNFSNIEIGSMFRFPKGAGDNVYMKVSENGSFNLAVAVLLSTGFYYSFDTSKEIEPVNMVQISR